MGWYEWRILEDGKILHDTRRARYDSPGIALRDALNYDAPTEAVQELHDLAHLVTALCNERRHKGLPLTELAARARQLAVRVTRLAR
ncbi:hypothetical protein [Modicisalibacter luteus]